MAHCSSAAAAQEYLLSVLGDTQGPVATRGGAGSPADLAFRLGVTVRLPFVRGRVVVRLRNAGKRVSPLTAEAAAIDAWLQKGARYVDARFWRRGVDTGRTGQ